MRTKSVAAAKNDNLVDGVDVEKVKIKLVTEALVALDVDITDLTPTSKVEALQFRNSKLSKDEKVVCSNCGGIGPVSSPACQFCGDEGEEETETPRKSTVPPPKATKLAKVAKVVDGPTARRLAVADVSPEFTEKALDAANVRIEEIRERAKHDYWELGKALLEVYGTGLWKARKKGNKVAYTSFNQYVAAELRIVPTTAYKMMSVAKHFSEAKIKQIGGEKLSLILKAPESERDSIMKEVEKGVSTRETKKKVEKARKKHGVTKINTGRKKMPAGKGMTHGKVRDGRITIAMVESSKTYELWAKPPKPLKDGEKPSKRAKSVKDEPYALIKLANGVEQLIEVIGSSAGLKLKIVTRRR